MVITATLSSGPVMVYYGQEVGEQGAGVEGFGGDDNRTTIFDYWGNPQHQQWLNEGKFDGAKLSADQKSLRAFYHQLLKVTAQNRAIREGELIEIRDRSPFNSKQYAFVRYTDDQRVLVLANFDRKKTIDTRIQLPESLLNKLNSTHQIKSITDLMTEKSTQNIDLSKGIPVKVLPSQALILSF
jgi:glycosidase